MDSQLPDLCESMLRVSDMRRLACVCDCACVCLVDCFVCHILCLYRMYVVCMCVRACACVFDERRAGRGMKRARMRCL